MTICWWQRTLAQLRQNKVVHHIYLLVTEAFANEVQAPERCTFIVTENVFSSECMLSIANHVQAEYALFCLKTTALTIGYQALERMLRVATDTDAKLLYSDRYSIENGETVKHPVIDYQPGSIRDDFDFGSVVLLNGKALREAPLQFSAEGGSEQVGWKYAGWYDLRLYLSRIGRIVHLNEFLYTEEELDLRKSGEKQFDYVNPQS